MAGRFRFSGIVGVLLAFVAVPVWSQAAAGYGAAAGADQSVAGAIAALQQNNRRMAAALAALQADFGVLQENQRRLLGALEVARQQNAEQARELQRGKARIAALENQVAVVEKRHEVAIARLTEAVAEESRTRKKSIKELIGSLSQVIATTVNKVKEQAVPAAAGGSTYEVKRGDTLSAIAQAFNVSIEDLQQANALSGTLIREGQTLVIPNR